MADGVWPEVLIGDALSVLRTLPDESVHCAITSPPYWALRSYLPDGHEDKHQEIGLEPTPEAHVAVLLEVFREVWRVLRRDGTLWCNYGDCYACAPNGRKAADIVNDDRAFRDKPFSTVTRASYRQDKAEVVACAHRSVIGLKPKDLVGMPWRLAFALQADGWWLRSAITLCKNNPMPESVTDRPTQATEMLFLLAKAPAYFYDSEAIREENSPQTIQKKGSIGKRYIRNGEGQMGVKPDCAAVYNSAGRNRRNWWVLNSQPLAGYDHFAAFSEKLVEPCILAGTSEAGCCPECGAPWKRQRKPTEEYAKHLGGDWSKGSATDDEEGRGHFVLSNGRKSGQRQPKRRPDTAAGLTAAYETTGWQPTCTHQHPQAALVPCTVLDIFAGSGTTLRVATRLGRRSIGIELSETYVKDILRKRTAQGGLGL